MKKILTVLCLVLLVSCSNEVPPDELVERDGITYEVNSTTPFTGSSVSYHENGQLSTKVNIKNGKPDGLMENYYENGQLWEVIPYKDGVPDGSGESYYENGQWETKENFIDGKEPPLSLKLSYWICNQLVLKNIKKHTIK